VQWRWREGRDPECTRAHPRELAANNFTCLRVTPEWEGRRLELFVRIAAMCARRRRAQSNKRGVSRMDIFEGVRDAIQKACL